MTDYLLDTNHASKLMGDDPELRRRIREASADGARFGISVTVLGELYFAAHASQHRDRNLEALASLLAGLILWPFDPEAAAEFGRIQAAQRGIGRPIPPLDAQIAAVARRQGAIVLSADRHFSLIQGLDTKNWIT